MKHRASQTKRKKTVRIVLLTMFLCGTISFGLIILAEKIVDKEIHPVRN